MELGIDAECVSWHAVTVKNVEPVIELGAAAVARDRATNRCVNNVPVQHVRQASKRAAVRVCSRCV